MRIMKWYGDNPIDGFLMVSCGHGEGVITISYTRPSGKGRGNRIRLTRSYDIVAVGKLEATVSLSKPTAKRLLDSVTPKGDQIGEVEYEGSLAHYV